MSFKMRLSDERGYANHGWLKSYHTFSFADYHDPAHMGFRSLRVINEDYIAGGKGFGSHPHQDMEIITYVLDGVLAHKDSMGHQEKILAGDIQKMSAGPGIVHSEFNADPQKTVHLFQIWIQPNKRGIAPAYQQISIPPSFKDGLRLIAGEEKGAKTIPLQQNARLYLGRFKAGSQHSYSIQPKRGIWLQMITGQAEINKLELNDSDALAIENETSFNINIIKDCEFLLFDLA